MAIKEKIRSIYRDIKEAFIRSANFNLYKPTFMPIYHPI